MVLEVPFEGFVSEVQERLPGAGAYWAPTSYGVQVTASNPPGELIIFSRTSFSPEQVQEQLAAAGMSVRRGAWIGEEEMSVQHQSIDLHVAAVAYKSSEERPGLWIEAYPTEPTPHDVLCRLFAEFREAGLLEGLELDDFQRIADPNVIIVGPERLRAFAADHQAPSA